jgi:hypothetical protein
MDVNDPNYERFGMHIDCVFLLQEVMVKKGFIVVPHSCPMQFHFTKRFEKFLNRTMNHTRLHITRDDTVSDDLIDMQGVLRAVLAYTKGTITDKEVFLFSDVVFNALMLKRYGSSMTENKYFESRVNEFLTEVYSIRTSEEEHNLFRRILKKE